MKKILLISMLLLVVISGCVQQTTQKQEVADTVSMKLISPQDGDNISSTTINIKFNVTNFRLVDATPTLPNNDRQGHVNYYLDNALQMSGPYTSASFTDVKPGMHTVGAELVNNDNSSFSPRRITIIFVKVV